MINIWKERIDLGLHPDAQVQAAKYLTTNNYHLYLAVEAYWSEARQLLETSGAMEGEDWLRQLPTNYTHDRIERLPPQKGGWPMAALVRRVVGFVDNAVSGLRGFIATSRPQFECRACRIYKEWALTYGEALGTAPGWLLPEGWLRLAHEGEYVCAVCPAHPELQEGEMFSMPKQPLRIVERG